MRVFILMAFLSIVSFFVTPISSYAQDMSAASQEVKGGNTQTSSKDNIFENASDEEIEEAQQFYKYCAKNDTMSKRKDCKCATVSYLRARLSLGSEATVKQIMKQNINTCLTDEARGKIDKTRATRDLSEISDSQLEEAEAVFQHCKARRALGSQFDCECFAARFLDERLEIGPLAGWDQIFLRFKSECRNVVATTGRAYTVCMERFGVRSAVNMEPKEFCECYARKWAELFENFQGKITTDVKSSLRGLARGHCSDLDQLR